MGFRELRSILDDAMEVIEETSEKNRKEKKDITDIVREWEQERGLEPTKLPEQKKKSGFKERSYAGKNSFGNSERLEAIIDETVNSKHTEKPLDEVIRERQEHPIELECPKCGGKRSFDRLAGFIKCESCGAAETLHPSQFYDRRLDMPPSDSRNSSGESNNKRTKAETLSLASMILGALAIVFLGAGGVPECTGVVLAEMVLKSADATPKDRRCAKIGVILCVIGILEMCLLIFLDTARKRL